MCEEVGKRGDEERRDGVQRGVILEVDIVIYLASVVPHAEGAKFRA